MNGKTFGMAFAIGMLLAFMLYPIISYGMIQSVTLVDDPIWHTGKKILLVRHSGIRGDKIEFSDYLPSGDIKQCTNCKGEKLKNSYSLTLRTIKNDAVYGLSYLFAVFKPDYRESEERSILHPYSQEEIDEWVNQNCFDFDGDGLFEYRVREFSGRVVQIACMGNGGVAGIVYRIESPRADWAVKFTVSNGETTKEKIISSSTPVDKTTNKEYSVWSGYIDDLAYISFDGKTIIDYVPTPSNLYVFYDRDLKKYYIIDSFRVNDYLSEIRDDGESLVGDILDGRKTKEYVINDWLSKIAEMRYWTTSADWSSNVVSVSPSGIRRDVRSFDVPSFTMYLNGQYFKIKVPRGEPKIVDKWWEKSIYEGGTFNLFVRVRNIGEGTGTFVATTTCEPPMNVITKTVYVGIVDPGEEKIFKVVVSTPEIEKDVSGKCRVVVKDTVGELSSSESVSYTIKNVEHCIEGHEYAEPTAEGGWKVKVCRNGEYVTKYTCPPGYRPIEKDGYYEGCEKEVVPPPKPECEWWDIACHIRKAISWITSWITEKVKTGLMWIGLIAVAIFVLLYVVPALLPKVRR